MLTQNCRDFLDTVISSEIDHPFKRHRISDISAKMGQSFDVALSLAKELERDHFAEIEYLHMRNGQVIPEYVILTEKGRSYKQFLRNQKVDYLKQKWIDFLALVVAALALAISIAAYIRTG